MEKEKNQNKKNKNSVLKIVLIVICAYFLMIMMPILFIFGLSFLDSRTDAKIENSTAIIANGNIKIETLDNYYNEETKCYVIQSKIEKMGNLKKNIFGFVSSRTVNVTYTLKDSDDYIIGSAYIFVDGVEKDDKWKPFATYCEDGANQIKNIEITEVDLY